MDNFRCFGRIGEGAHGVVFEAKEITTGQKVAIKKIPLKRLDDGLPVQAGFDICARHWFQYDKYLVMKVSTCSICYEIWYHYEVVRRSNFIGSYYMTHIYFSWVKFRTPPKGVARDQVASTVLGIGSAGIGKYPAPPHFFRRGKRHHARYRLHGGRFGRRDSGLSESADPRTKQGILRTSNARYTFCICNFVFAIFLSFYMQKILPQFKCLN